MGVSIVLHFPLNKEIKLLANNGYIEGDEIELKEIKNL